MLKRKPLKCLVWDLDNTLWEGVLLEDKRVSVSEAVIEIVKTLDSRGILQSIASKNDHTQAMALLNDLGLADYFLYPQINWNSKASSIQEIARALNIGLDSIAFIDDQPFELSEVSFSLPQVLTIEASDLADLLARSEFTPESVTEESKKRRLLYLSEMQRNQAEAEYSGAKEAFLATLNMVFTIAPPGQEDLQRAEELTVRTNQLNTTGITYSYEELDAFRLSGKHKLLMAGLEDKFGDYGKIGLALVECQAECWTLKLLLISCRVISRGVGNILLQHIMGLAKQAGVRLRAEFLPNERNRMMFITFRFAGFKVIEQHDDCQILESDLSQIQPVPAYVKLVSES